MFPTGVWHFPIGLDMVTDLWYTYVLYLDFEVAKDMYIFKFWLGLWRMLEVPTLISIWIWSLEFGSPIFQILVLYLYFEDAKNHHFLWVPIWGFGGHWRFLTGVWHQDLDLDMVKNLAWVLPEVLKMFRSVKVQIQSLSMTQISSDRLVPGGQVGVGLGLDSAKIRFGTDWANQNYLYLWFYLTVMAHTITCLSDWVQCTCLWIVRF